MIVRELQPLGKDRFRIITDEAFAFVLYKGELPLYHIEPGVILDPQAIQKIYDEILYRRVKARALKLLLQRPYTTRQLKDKLLDGGYPEELADYALAYVGSFHYVDDDLYAENFIRSKMDAHSRKEIEHTLSLKGIGRETIAEAFLRLEEADELTDDHAVVADLLKKRRYTPASGSEKDREKQIAYLIRKGFSLSTVLDVMKQYD